MKIRFGSNVKLGLGKFRFGRVKSKVDRHESKWTICLRPTLSVSSIMDDFEVKILLNLWRATLDLNFYFCLVWVKNFKISTIKFETYQILFIFGKVIFKLNFHLRSGVQFFKFFLNLSHLLIWIFFKNFRLYFSRFFLFDLEKSKNQDWKLI